MGCLLRNPSLITLNLLIDLKVELWQRVKQGNKCFSLRIIPEFSDHVLLIALTCHFIYKKVSEKINMKKVFQLKGRTSIKT